MQFLAVKKKELIEVGHPVLTGYRVAHRIYFVIPIYPVLIGIY